MGYFQADERYLTGGGKTTVEPPWRVEVRETGEPGQVYLTWRRPYAPVDSFGIYGQDTAGPAPATWQELLRVPGTAAEACIRLAPGAWDLAVNARLGNTDSPLVRAVPALPTPAAQPIRVAAPLPLPEPLPEPPPPAPPSRSEYTQADTDHGTRNTHQETLSTQHSALSTPSFGWCNCCRPPRPLIRQGDALICPAHPERHYGRPLPFGDGRNDRNARREREPPPPGPVPEPVPELDWTAIDSALRANSAQLGRHGLFVRPATDDYDDRYR